MNNNSWFKKEMPLQTVIGFGGGATGFGAYSSAASKKYVDDIFSTYLWKGTGSARSINNGVDVSGEGAMVWIKKRDQFGYSNLYDTTRGVTKYLISSQPDAEATVAEGLTAFNDNGFSLGTSGYVNTSSGDTYASWTFRKSPGFFDVVTWTGDNSGQRNISHSLGSNVGMIIAKRTDSSTNWHVWHRELPNLTSILELDNDSAVNTGSDAWGYPSPSFSSSSFSVDNRLNDNGATYIAYVYAGGESTATTATSVYTESTGYLGLDESTDFDLGTSDFTIEAWVRPLTGDRSGNTFNILSFGYPFNLYYVADASVAYSGKFTYDGSTSNSTNNQLFGGNTGANSVEQNQWNHVALTRSGSTFRFFLNGTLKHTSTSSSAFGTNTVHGCKIGYGTPAGTQYFQGDVSNLRYVLGTALYTSSFKPSTEPLSNVTNTKLLCCQGSTTSSATVSPGTITAYNSPSWKAYSPFDDPEGFKFGEDEDSGIIKCGSYKGNASSNGPEINVGWEPQWILLKRLAGGTGNWAVFDSMRGIKSEGYDPVLQPDLGNAEYTSTQYLDLTSTGFQLKGNFAQSNASGDTYIYVAIRKPDGYVGKLPSAGTGVFAMDTGNSSTTIPTYDSGFPVDLAISRAPDSVADWYNSSRITGLEYLSPNLSNAAASDSNNTFDSNVGWNKGGTNSSYQNWMWKQCPKGFDMVTYTGGGSGDIIPHNLNAVPEMMWVKNRSAAQSWAVYHKGLNGGTNPEQYYQMLNSPLGTNTLGTETNRWNDIAPTSTHFSVGGSNNTGNGGDNYVAMLFASANNADGDPISKVGYYTGDNTNDGSKVITLGFQPRFIVIKASNAEEVWVVLDTLRGIQNDGNDKQIYFDRTDAQVNNTGVDLSATGFALRQASGEFNANGYNYLYYAHA